MSFLIINKTGLTVNRYSKTLSYGKGVKSLDTSFTINAQVQPISGIQLQILEEGKRSRRPRLILTENLLLVDDEIIIDGITYLIDNVSIRGDQLWLQHYECVAIKKKET